MLRAFVLFCIAGLAQAGIGNVQVIGSTNVQAVLSYQSSIDGTCTLQVSEKPDFRPLVHDVNPVLFPGADSDARPGNVSNGRNRIFVVGRRAVAQAADKKWYSLALQVDTVHYYQIQCGSDVATGSFRTANLPVGTAFPWPYPQDPQTGNFRWPSTDTDDRSQTIIDPNYGTLIRRVTVPGEQSGTNWIRRSFASASGNGWTNPAASLANDGDAAQYSGTTQDWLVTTDLGLSIAAYLLTGQAVDSVLVWIRGSGQGASESDRSIDVCLTVDGVRCRGEIRTMVLDSRESLKALGSTKPVDTWGAPLWQDELQSKTFGVMIRASGTSGAPISIQSVQIDIINSGMGSMPENGFLPTCAPVKSNGGFHCSVRSFGGNGSNALYWIHPDTGEVRPLGSVVATGWGGPATQCATNWAAFDSNDPNVYYCSARVGSKTVLLKGTYTGNDKVVKTGTNAPITWVNLTPDPNTITDMIKAFNPDFDTALFSGCMLASLAGNVALFTCKVGNQDSIGWLAAFDMGNGQPVGSGGTGKLIAAAKSYAAANTRWCGIHATEHMEMPNWFGWGAERLTGGGGAGTGPYNVTLTADMPAQTGSMTIQVSGEPQPYLMDTQVGDIFILMNRPNAYDIVRIVQKNSPTEWVVERFVPYGGSPVTVPAGTVLSAFCNGVNPNDPKPGVQAYWNFVADPNGQDTTNTTWVAEKVLTGGHLTQRGNYRIMVDHRGYQIITPGPPDSFNKPVTYKITANPRWQGVRAGVGLGDDRLEGVTTIYQGHPSYENFRTEGRNNWFIDLIPFIGGPSITSAVAPVSGYTQLYRAQGAQLHRDTFPTFAVCSGRQLKDVSPGPIGDADQYSYCVGSSCISGAGASDAFINCPAPAGSASRCSPALGGDNSSVCVADMAPYGQSITQFFFDSSGLRNRVLTNGLFPWQSPRTPMPLNTASALPDGSWVLFPSYGSSARKDIYMVKVPASPEFDPDPARWTRAVPVNISVTPTVPGVAQAMLQYGSSSKPQSTEKITSCKSGAACSATVMVRPLDLIFGNVVFQDAGGQTLAVGDQVQVSSGISGSGTGKPVFNSTGVVNSASLEQKLAPGSMISIFGSNLADCELQGSYPLPATLCNASVTFNGQPGLLLYAQPSQLNVLLPSSVVPGQDVQIVVTRLGVASDPVTIPGAAVQGVAPAIFTYLDGIMKRVTLRNADGSLNGPASLGGNFKPLKPGQAASLYVTGLGPVNPAVPDGQPAPSDALAATVSPVSLVINGVSQPVSFSGLAPGLSGIYLINFTVDPSTPTDPGDQSTIQISIQGASSPPATVSLAAAR